MKKITFTETLKVVQLPEEDIIEATGTTYSTIVFEDNASFKDADKTIGEYMLSIGDIDEMLDFGFSDERLADYLVTLKEKMNEVGASYVQVVKV